MKIRRREIRPWNYPDVHQSSLSPHYKLDVPKAKLVNNVTGAYGSKYGHFALKQNSETLPAFNLNFDRFADKILKIAAVVFRSP